MSALNEKEVATSISNYFESKGLTVIGKHDVFNHTDDDADERPFEIDLAIGPVATKGIRTQDEINHDKEFFERHAPSVDGVVGDLMDVSLFPKSQDVICRWRREPNPNPVVGIAVEIENNMSKYFLGSLLAAAIAGRWGIVVVPDCAETPRWISTLERMMHKGHKSPIPSNISVFTWPQLKHKIECG